MKEEAAYGMAWRMRGTRTHSRHFVSRMRWGAHQEVAEVAQLPSFLEYARRELFGRGVENVNAC